MNRTIIPRSQSVAIAYAIVIGGLLLLQSIVPPSVYIASLVGLSLAICLILSPMSILALLIIVAPLQALILTEAPYLLPIDLGVILLLIWAAITIANRIIEHDSIHQWSLSPILIPLILFIAITGVTGIHAINPSMWLSEWLKWVLMLATALLTWNTMRDHWRWIPLMLVVAGTAHALVGIYIFLGGSGADHLRIQGQYFRAFGTFGQPNPFGGFMGLMLPFALLAAFHYGTAYLKDAWQQRHLKINRHLLFVILIIVSTGIMLLALVMSWSRGAWMAFMASILVMVFAIPRRLHLSVILAFMSVLGIVVVWQAGFIPQTIIDRLASSFAEYFNITDVRGVDITGANYAVVERIAHWQAAINMFYDNWWLGVGFGNYDAAYSQYRLMNWEYALGHAHNYYLNILAETGIIGFLSYGWLWGTIILMSWRLRQHPDPFARSIAIALLGVWTYLAVHSLLDNLYVNNLYIHFGVMIGLLAILHQQLWQTTNWKKT